MRQSAKGQYNFKETYATRLDFPNYSSSEGAPSDCSEEAYLSRSVVEGEVEHEAVLQVIGLELLHNLHFLGSGPGSGEGSYRRP